MNHIQLKEILVIMLPGISEQIINQFLLYEKILIEENIKYNLTSITNSNDIYIKHFYDSLLIKKICCLNKNVSLIDIGSGAGFPGIPLKICFPNLSITLLEPNGKRSLFLQKVINTLHLNKIEVVNLRAEEYVKTSREKYDYATARAVAKLNILSELSLPFVKINGHFIAMKGLNIEEELNEANNSIEILGGKIIAQSNFELPQNLGQRQLIKIEKVKKTPQEYPRIFSKIKKNPL